MSVLYSLCPKMFIDFVDIEIVWHTMLSGQIFDINATEKHLILNNHFGIKITGGKTIVSRQREYI